MAGSFWQRLLDLVRSPREPYVAAPEPFLRFDREAVRRELQPKEKGHAAAAEELPPSDATGPDTREVSITRYCQNELDAAHEKIRMGIDTLLRSIRQTTGKAYETKISQLRETGVSQIQSVAKQQRNVIESTLRHTANLEQSFERFREQNKRDTLPDLSKGGALSYAVLVVMVAIETAANGTLFAQGNDFGFLGGVAQALVFAAANVVLGVITAHALRQATHIAWWRRVPMGVVVLALAAVGLLLNLGVAQFRDALLHGTPQNDATRAAVEHLQNGNVMPGDLVSWLLFGMGYTFFWVACIDVMRMSDPYPGYASRYEALLRSQDDYSLAVAETHHRLGSIRDRFSREISEVARDADSWSLHAASLRDNLARLSSSYERHGADVREFHRQLIEDYRDANRLSRKTPVPAYFARWTELELKPVPSYELELPASDVSTAASQAIGEMTAMHDKEIQTLMPLSDLGKRAHVNSQT